MEARLQRLFGQLLNLRPWLTHQQRPIQHRSNASTDPTSPEFPAAGAYCAWLDPAARPAGLGHLQAEVLADRDPRKPCNQLAGDAEAAAKALGPVRGGAGCAGGGWKRPAAIAGGAPQPGSAVISM